eukprot:CAMPEP_0118936702 /NCGR_PEP_ID=MMETSP1169-20130426/20086_1 /TAXON_ID=36882 /ORGANISM="Pyramimonas obovata, Strain CCMP722" /LENGTH=94 /DNA_ID=CAMNT_0006880055 /DNA_START=90 /DNA_END=371 /DNA_ORIENTATION=+
MEGDPDAAKAEGGSPPVQSDVEPPAAGVGMRTSKDSTIEQELETVVADALNLGGQDESDTEDAGPVSEKESSHSVEDVKVDVNVENEINRKAEN